MGCCDRSAAVCSIMSPSGGLRQAAAWRDDRMHDVGDRHAVGTLHYHAGSAQRLPLVSAGELDRTHQGSSRAEGAWGEALTTGRTVT